MGTADDDDDDGDDADDDAAAHCVARMAFACINVAAATVPAPRAAGIRDPRDAARTSEEKTGMVLPTLVLTADTPRDRRNSSGGV